MPALDAVARLTRDLKTASAELSPMEARFLVDAYYTTQDYRISAANQGRALNKAGEPSSVIEWLFEQESTLEKQLQRALDAWTDAQPLGVWLKSIIGIGPVIAAGMMAHIDIKKAPSEGHIWAFAGLNPTVTWDKGQKRPWNGDLRTLCWKAGESFVITSGHERSFYGPLYRQRKEMEVRWNEEGRNAEAARQALANKKYGEETIARQWYEQGKLPPAHVHARARRWTVKLFLSHYHVAAMWLQLGQTAPRPYVIGQLEHVDRIWPPSLDLLPGWTEAHKVKFGEDPRNWIAG